MRLTSRPFALLALLTLLALSIPLTPRHTTNAQAILAAARKLSAITATDGTVQRALVAGERVVFLADYDESGRFDLYSAPLAGGAAVRLSAGIPAGTVEDVKVSAAGQVVFSSARSTDQRRYLYSVPAAGGAPALIGPTYPATQPAGPAPGSQLVFGLAGERVVFAVDAQRGNGFELFSAPVAGGQPLRISQALPAAPGVLFSPAWVGAFDISADGAQVVYLRRGSFFGLANSLYGVPVTGGTPQLLASGVPASNTRFAIAPNGARVVFATDAELRTVPLGGGPSALIESGSFIPFTITGDSARVVYATSSGNAATISSAPIASGGATVITSDARYAFTLGRPILTPDGSSVLYNDSAATALLSAPIAGGAPRTIFNAPVTPEQVKFSADGARALFVTGNGGSYALYSYPLAGGTAARIDDPALSAGGFLGLEGITPGGRALYIARTAAASAVRLYSVPVAGGATATLSGDLGPDQGAIVVRAAGDTVIFTSGPIGIGGPPIWRRIYAVPADGSAAARLVDQSRALVGDVDDYAVSEADGRAVYLADQTTDRVRELFSVPLAGGTPTRLNAAGQTVVGFKVSPAGGRVVYAALPAGQATASLFSVPIGGGAATPIVANLPSGSAEIAFTPDGARVLFRATNVAFPDASTLYSAPAAGGNATTIAENVTRFFLDPTSKHVVFLNDLLRSAPVAGGSVADLGAVGNLTALDGQLLITPDGARVIYAPTNFAGLKGYVSQPIAGGATTELVAPADNPARPTVQLSADGAYLLYGAQQPITNLNDPLVYRIQRIPVAGGAAVTLRELILPAESQSLTFDFSQAPGGGPVVYHISRTGPNTTVEHTLGSVPVSGGQAVTIYGPANISRVDLPYTLSDDGEQVLFRAVNALYRVPAAGGVSPVKISGESAVAQFGFAGDAAIFIEGGDLTYAPLDGEARQLERPADDARARSFVVAGETVVFTGVRPVSTATGETVELYAVDLAEELKVFLPMISR